MQMIQAEVERLNASAKLLDVTPEQKAQSDRKAWQGWLARYGARLHRQAQAGADPHKRVQIMNATNPRCDIKHLCVADNGLDACTPCFALAPRNRFSIPAIVSSRLNKERSAFAYSG